MMADKDIEEMVDGLPKGVEILVCNLNTERSSSSKELKQICDKKGRKCKAFDSVKDAIIYCGKKDTLIVGSFYTVSESREHLRMDGYSEL